MTANPIAPQKWTNAPLVLYHGTLWTYAQSIQNAGKINPALGRLGTDFGPGFYTTALEKQARSWAWTLAAQASPGTTGGVVTLAADRDQLSRLGTLAFIRGDYDAEDFWSFVFHCRAGSRNHSRAGTNPLYDVVYGPVAAFWMQRLAITNADQISFHTPAAAAVLTVTKIEPVP